MKQRRKILSFISAIACAVSFCAGTVTVSGADYSSEKKYGDYLSYYQVDEDEDGTYDYVEITDCKKTAVEIEIPAEIDGVPVTAIGSSAFESCKSLTSIKIPDGVTRIGSEAFYSCISLASIDIPDGVTSIGSWAFSGCTSLESINIPDGVTLIEYGAFSGCTSLESINIPDGVTLIEDGAFSNCTSLESINIPDGVTRIGSEAFYGCISLASITIPDGVTSIGDSVFCGCAFLTSITIPDSVTWIGDSAFSNCYNLSSVRLPKKLESIGYMAFMYCVKLTNIELPESLKYIEDYAFYCCASLTNINIPDSVIEIDEAAFGDCVNLVSIKIPNSITKIHSGTFYGCKSLSLAEIPDSVTYIDKSAFYCYDNLIICGSEGSYAETYAKTYAEDNNITFVPISQNPEIKSYGALKYMQEDSDEDGKLDCIKIVYCDKSATEVNIPDNIDGLPVTSIRGFAFAGDLLNVSFGNGVEKDISNITSVSIPDSVTYIGEQAFDGTPMIYNQATKIKYADNWAVSSSHNYRGALKIKDGTRGIANEAFDTCYDLEAIYIPDSVIFIGDNVFKSEKEDFTIFGNEGSAAQNYAEEYNITFNTLKLELGKYEYQLNYDGKIKLYFFPDEAGTYHFESKLEKYHELCINDSSASVLSGSTEQYITIECNTDEVYSIQLEPYYPGDSDAWKSEYKWAEGDSEKGSLWIYKEVTEEKTLDELKKYTVSANTYTSVKFTADKPVGVVIDAGELGYILYDSDDDYIHEYGYNYALESGTYTLKFNAADEDTVIKVKIVNDSSCIYSGVDENENGIIDYLSVVEIANFDESIEEVVIPSEFNGLPVKEIYGYLNRLDCLKSIYIPDSMVNIGGYRSAADPFLNFINLESINVSEDNKNYSSIDGVLFNKDKTEILAYPRNKKDTQYSIPDSVKIVGKYAFRYSGLENVKVPEKVESIGDYAFDSCQNLKSITILNPKCEIALYSAISNEFNKEGPSKFNGTIYGYEGSTAQAYAENHEINFKPISEKPVTTTPAVTTTVTTTTTTTSSTASSAKTTENTGKTTTPLSTTTPAATTDSKTTTTPAATTDSKTTTTPAATTDSKTTTTPAATTDSKTTTTPAATTDSKTTTTPAATTDSKTTTTVITTVTTDPNKLVFTPNPEFVEFLEKTNREATVTQTDKGIRILVYNHSDDPSGHPVPPLKMTVPSGWQITYSIEAIDPSPQTVSEGIVNGNGYFIYYVLVEKTGDVVYTENEILNWYLSMDIGETDPVTTTTAVTTGISTTTKTTAATTTPAATSTSATESKTTTTPTAGTSTSNTSDTASSTAATTTTTSTTTSTTTDYVLGDANGDGQFTIRDAAWICIMRAKGVVLTIETNPAADYNGDGSVSVRDAAAIAIYFAKKSVQQK